MSVTPGRSGDWHLCSVAQLHQSLQAREVSAEALAQHFLGRIEASRLNAFIDVRPDLTLAQARAADERLARGERGPLLGVPIAHKDIFVTRGWRSTAGSRMLADYVSPFDAAVVDRLAAAGAVCLGKTNCDEFAMGSSSEHSHFGAVRNPWDPAAIPGGSSGGSAAAVAAGLAPLATGTDTGGSVRQPRVDVRDQRHQADLRPGVAIRHDRVRLEPGPGRCDGPLGRGLRGAAVGDGGVRRPRLDQPGAPRRGLPRVDRRAACRPAHRPAARSSSARGWRRTSSRPFAPRWRCSSRWARRCVAIALPRTRLAIPAYYVIAPAEASSNLSRFDGVRYGHRAAQYQDLRDMYCKTRAQGFGDEVRRRIMVGTYVLSHGYYDAYYLQAQKLRRLISDDFGAAFGQVDVIAGPVSPTVAWDIGTLADDPVKNYLADVFTLSTSLAGLPGMSVPAGFGDRGRPVGLQLIGPWFAEARLLAVAHRLQQSSDWHLQRAPHA